MVACLALCLLGTCWQIVCMAMHMAMELYLCVLVSYLLSRVAHMGQPKAPSSI